MSQDSAARHDDAVPWIDLELELRQQTPRQWAKRFQGVSQNEFNRLMIVLERHATNTQIQKLFSILESKKFHQAHLLSKWKSRLTLLSPCILECESRYTFDHLVTNDHWLTHYKCKDFRNNNASAPCRPAIIGFTDICGVLMTPTPCVLTSLATIKYDLILIRRRRKTGYFDNSSSLLLSTIKNLRLRLKNAIHQSITIGTSNGGLAALWAARELGLPLGIAIGPGVNKDTFIESGPLISATSRFTRSSLIAKWPWTREFKTKLLIAASANNDSDRESAISTSDYFNKHKVRSAEATALLFPGCTDHNLIDDLSRRGFSLSQLLIPLVKQELGRLPLLKSQPQKTRLN